MSDDGPRLHQSYCKDLLTRPALVKRQLDGIRRKATKAMDLGTLLDRHVFGGMDDVGVVDAKDLRTKKAQEQAKAIREAGKTPVLKREWDAAAEMAKAVLEEVYKWIEPSRCATQRTYRWVGPHGVLCEGTPDAVYMPSAERLTWDLKLVASADPDDLERQIYKFGWDIQAAAYTEATGAEQHVIVAAEKGGAGEVVWYPLSDEYLDVGRQRWSDAAAIWKRCLETGEWPGYQSRTLHPPRYAVMRHLGGDGDISALGLEE